MLRARVVAVVGALALFLVSAGGASATTPSWTVQRAAIPKGSTDTYLNAVSCASLTMCVGVGNYSVNFTGGATVASAWDGTRWKIQRTPAGATNLQGVSCSTTTSCAAVGNLFNTTNSTRAAVAEVWNGIKWATKRTQAPKGSTNSELVSVSCTAVTACVAVGDYSTSGGVDTPMADVWNGTKWVTTHPVVPAQSPSTAFKSVSCTSATACVAVGISYLPGGSDTQALGELWNGTKWTALTMPTPAGGVLPQVLGVSCTTAPTACVAVGNYRVGSPSATPSLLIEAWDGATWTLQSTPAVTGGLFGVSCVSSTACIAVGGYGTAIALGWNGVSWSKQTVPTPAGMSAPVFFGVSCTASSACTGVGSDNNSGGHLQPLIERYS